MWYNFLKESRELAFQLMYGLLLPSTEGGNGIGGYVYHDLAELFSQWQMAHRLRIVQIMTLQILANKRDPRFMFTVTYDGCIMKSNMQDTEINISVGTQQDAIYRGTRQGIIHINS